MRLNRLPLFRLFGLFLIASMLGGCAGTQEAGVDTRSFTYEADMYRVEIDQRNQDGDCVRRTILFTSYNRLYTQPKVDRVRAVDNGCDATYTPDFEEFEIQRAPNQRSRYENSSSFRQRINDDLWDSYRAALFDVGEL